MADDGVKKGVLREIVSVATVRLPSLRTISQDINRIQTVNLTETEYSLAMSAL